MREVDGFTLEPTAEFMDLQEPGWLPQIRVVRQGTDFDETAHQSVELSPTREEAIERATTWMNRITEVSYHGELHFTE
ncbi:hypothetical protein LJR168_001774 [Pseudoxanthomonas sp. LjRoot168]|uniref:hypothetical protein n=1 Tax=unclassified Pseudoxanthomonas TaxID=2645906 RepID=UPI003ECF4446